MSGWNRRDSGEMNGRTQNQDNICPNYQRVFTDGLGRCEEAAGLTDGDAESLWWLNVSQNMIFMDRRVYILHQ